MVSHRIDSVRSQFGEISCVNFLPSVPLTFLRGCGNATTMSTVFAMMDSLEMISAQDITNKDLIAALNSQLNGLSRRLKL